MSDVVDWIRGRDAFHLVAMVGSIGSAAGRLREPLLRGRVASRAMDGTLEMRRGHGKKEVQDWDVPKEAWKGRRHLRRSALVCSFLAMPCAGARGKFSICCRTY